VDPLISVRNAANFAECRADQAAYPQLMYTRSEGGDIVHATHSREILMPRYLRRLNVHERKVYSGGYRPQATVVF